MTARAVVLFLIGAALPAIGFVTAGPAPEAEARVATGGSGKYLGQIDWIEWGADGDVITNGKVATSTRNVGGSTLVTTCTLTNLVGDAKAYRSGDWTGDGMDNLYNIGGTDKANQLIAGIGNRFDAGAISFNVSCSATLDGVSVPLRGLVIGDGEATGFTTDVSKAEYIQAKPATAATWRIIDRFRAAGCTSTTRATVAADNTLKLDTSAGNECAGGGPMAVGFMEGATAGSFSLKGAGSSAINIGAVIEADFGDAPLPYGAAGALTQGVWTGGVVAAGTTTNDVSGNGFTLANLGPSTFRLGATIDSEASSQRNATATGDDIAGTPNDEDSFTLTNPAQPVLAGDVVTSTVQCTATSGFVAAWYDWNGNGVFDAGEKSNEVACTGGAVTLSWTVPADVGPTATTFVRVRLSNAAGIQPTGMVTNGEVEDYAVQRVRATPAMTLNKVASKNPVVVGDVVTYTFTITNTGNYPFANTTISDPQLGISNASCGPLAVGASVTCTTTGTHTITQADVDAGGYSNTATSAATDSRGATIATATDVENVTATRTASIDLTKSAALVDGDGDGRADVGETVNYTFTVTNTGNTTLTNVTVTDAKLGLNGAACVATLAPGATATCSTTGTYVVAQSDVDSGAVNNTASTSATSPTGPVTDTAAAQVPADTAASMTMTKSGTFANDVDGDGLADVGDTITYSFTVTNTGKTTLSNVTVTDAKLGVNAAACVATLAPAATATCSTTATYTVTQGDIDAGAINNTATTQGTPPSGPAVTAQASAVKAVDNSSSMTMTKSGTFANDVDGDGLADVGDTITYTFSVTNTGNSTISNVTVTDAKLGLTNAACVATLAPAQTATCSTTATYTVTQADVDAGSVSNSATTNGTDAAGGPVDASAAAVKPTDVASAMTMTKSGQFANDMDGDGLADVGDTITYSFTVTNGGNTTLSNVTVTDAKLGLTAQPCVATLAPGATAPCTTTATYTVTQADVDSGSVANTATATGADPAGNPVSATAIFDVPADTAASMAMTKSGQFATDADGDGLADVGDVITYSFAVQNTGKTTLSNVTVTDAKLGITAQPCVATLAPGASATCQATATYTVTQADVDAGSVANTATTDASDPAGNPVTATDDFNVPADTAASMTMTKSGVLTNDADADGVADLNDTITYTFTVTNTGKTTLSNVTVTDAKLGLTDAACVATLAPGATATCQTTATYTVTQADVDSGSVRNTATATGLDPSGAPVTDDGAATVVADTTAGLQLAKNAGLADTNLNGFADAGEAITFTFDVTNTGNTTLTNVTIDDAKLGLTGAACVDSLAPGETATCSTAPSYVVTQADVDAGAVANSATATGSDPSGTPVTGGSSTTTPTNPSQGLSLVKSATLNDADMDGVADVGETITYSFSVTNTGSVTLAPVTIDDAKLNLSGAACVDSLAPGQTATCTTTVDYPVTQTDVDAGSVDNTATATGINPSGAPVTGSSMTSTPTDPTAIIELVKSATLIDGDGDGLADAGESITYAFSVTNKGTTTLSNVTVSDPMLGLVDAACVDTLAPGATATCAATGTYTVTQADVDAGSIVNTATTDATDPFGNPVTDDASAVVAADVASELALVKDGVLNDADGDNLADAGETITYTFTVTNTGNVTLSNLTITDAKLGLTDAACVDSLAPGATATCSTTVDYTVTQADVDAGRVDNSATASGNPPSGDPVTAGATDTVPADTTAKIELAKSAALSDTDMDGQADLGETITYTFDVTNTGNVTLSNVTIDDAKIGLVGAACVDTLAPGATATCSTTGTYTVTQADVDSGSVANTATASATDPFNNPVTDDAAAALPTDTAAGLELLKSANLIDADGDGRADAGETITYSFTVTNSANVTLTNVTIDDAKLGLVDAACVDTLAPGASATCSTVVDYTVTQADVDAGAVANSATATGSDPAGNPVTGGSSTSTTTDPTATMALVKSALLNDEDGDGVADAGESITYSFSVTNTGTVTLSNVTVTDAKLGLVDAACVDSLAPAATATCQATATYTVTQADVDSGSVANSATATASDPFGNPVTAGSATATPVDRASDIALVKTATIVGDDGDGIADVGETVSYEFTVTNTGVVTLSNVTITDPMLGLDGAACVDSLAPGASATCATTGTHLVTQADVDAGAINNTATANATDPFGNGVSADGSAEVLADTTAGLELVKSATLDDADGDGFADAGEVITYSFSVTNTGRTTLSNVTIDDAKLGLMGAACVDSLAPGASATCSTAPAYTVTQADVDAGTVANAATATGNDPSGNPVTGGSSTTTPTDPTSGLQLVKSAQLNDDDDDGMADAGETITYSFSVTNTGTVTLSNVTVTDAKLSLTDAACVDSLAPGQTATCTATVDYVVTQADVDAGSVDNSATATGSDPSGNPVTGSSMTSTPTDPTATIALVKSAHLNDEDGDGVADAGETITYSFSVTNTGTVTLSNVTITDAKLGLTDAACVDSLAPGATATCATAPVYTVTQADVDGGSVANTATTDATDPFGNPVTDDASAVVAADVASELALVKNGVLNDADGDNLADANETITYSFTVTNTGNVTLSNLTIDDAKLGLVDAACVDSLAPGATATCSTTVDYTVTQADVDAGRVDNSATATGADPSGNPVTAGASDTVPADTTAKIELTKQAELNDADFDGQADVGETITYTFYVANTGNVTLSNVTIDDPKLGLIGAACVDTLQPQLPVSQCSTTATYVVTQADVDSGSVANTATASATDPFNNPVTDDASAVLPTDTSAALVLVKSAQLNDDDGDGVADAGETITYSFTVTNTANVTLTDLTITDAKLGLTDAACVDSLAPGATATCTTTVDYTVTQADVDAGTVDNSATASGTDPSGNPVGGSSSTSTPTDPTATISLVKSAQLNDQDGDGIADAGETITYSFSVTNTGAVTLSNVTITDAKLGLTDAACVDSLAPGATAACATAPVYTVTQADVDSGGVANTATATGTDPTGAPVSDDSSTMTPADQSGELQLVKSAQLNDEDGDGVADAGETITYSFSVTNTGAVTLSNVTIDDAKLSLTDAACVDSLAPGATVTCSTTVDYTVTQADVDSGVVANSATASGTDPSGNPVTDGSSTTTPTDTASGLTLVKSAQLNDQDDDGIADAGETITYSFSVTNAGNVTLSNVTITDAKLGLTDAACVDSLAPGATATCSTTPTYVVTQADVDAGSVANAATATGTDPSGNPVTGGSSTTTPTDQASGLALVKSAQLNDEDGDGVADAGETITYSFSVTNTANVTLSNVTITDAKLALTDAACVDTLAPGQTVTCTTTVDYTVTQADVDAASVDNSATASGTDPSGNPVTGGSTTSTPTDPTATIALVKSAQLNDQDGDGIADAGETITYSFSVTNTGTVTLSNVTIDDAKLGLTGAACVESLAPGATATCATAPVYTVTQADVDGGGVANTATATGTDPTGTPVSDDGATITPTDPAAGLVMVKSAQLSGDDGQADVGETITYTFTVTNTGNVTLSNLTVDDAKLGLTAAACVDSLAPGATATCATAPVYTVTQADVDAGTVANSATATGTDPSGNPVTGGSSTTTPTDTAASIALVKSGQLNDADGDGIADAGETITYSFSVTNTGNTTISNVTIDDAKLGLTDAACVDSLAPGATATCSTTPTYTVTQADVDAGSVANAATASGTDPSGNPVTGGSSTTTPTDQASGLQLVKTAQLADEDGDGVADAGEIISYTFAVTNTGNVTLSNVTLNDAMLDLSNAPCVDSLAPGATANCETAASYTVTQADVDAGSVANAATATGSDPSGNPVTGGSSTTTPTDQASGLQLVKAAQLNDADGDGVADAGETITYSFTVTNTASVTLTNVIVSDAKLGLTNAACVESLAPGASATCSTTADYTVTQADVDAGTVANSATASGSDPAGNPVTGDSTTSTPTDPTAGLALQKVAMLDDADGDGQADTGETITYGFMVTNTGSTTLSNVTIDDAKLGLTDAACIDSLAPGATAACQVTADYTVTQADVDAGAIVNTASATGTDPSGNPTSGDSSTTTPTDPAASLQLVKTATLNDADGDGVADAGETINYSFTVTNNGSTTLSNVTVTDAKLGLSDAACVDSLAPGASVACASAATYTVTQADVDAGAVANSATASGTDPSGNPVDGGSSTQTPTDPTSALTLVKTATLDDADGDGVADAGESINYSFAVTNTGSTTLTSVVVSDAMLGLTNAACVEALLPGQSADCTSTGTYTVTQADVDAGAVANSATASGTDPSGNPVGGGSSTQTPTDPTASIALVKSGTLADTNGDGVAGVGEVVTYTFEVTNTGSVTLSDVVISDAKLGMRSEVCVATLAPGQSATCAATGSYTATQDDVDAGSIENTASVLALDPNGEPVTNSGTATNGTGEPPVTPVLPDLTESGDGGQPVTVAAQLPDGVDGATVFFPAEGQPTGSTVSADGKTLTVPGQGVWTVDADGNVTFTPEEGFLGDPTPISYSATDSTGQQLEPATVTVTYPQVHDVHGEGVAGQPVTVGTNLDPGMDPTTVIFPADGQPTGSTVSADGKTLTVPGEGVWTVNPDGSLTFTPEPGFMGSPTSVLYTARDEDGNLAIPATASISVSPPPAGNSGTPTPPAPSASAPMPVAPQSPAPPSKPLAYTGSPLTTIGIVGLALLLLGGGFALFGRRRSRDATAPQPVSQDRG